jgi:Zn-dependent peptidase ImmA (M78 family)
VDRPDPAVQALCDHHRETDPEKLVLRLCRDLLARCLTSTGPTNLRVMGSIQGARHIRTAPINPASGCSGILVPHDGGYEVTVNATEPPERRNFSIAHEIVHTFFRDVWPCCHPSAVEEKLCDIGAAELTMPLARFSARLRTYGLTLEGIDKCTREFGVSFEAAARRAVTTTTQPACLLIATLSRTREQEHLGTGEPMLRITKWWRSPCWPDQTSYTNLAVAPGSLISQAFTHLDQRQATGRLGITFHNQTCHLQTRGYAYPLPGNPGHRQAVTLAQPSQ